MNDNISEFYSQTKDILESELAVAKLFIIRYGLSINGFDLAAQIPDYLQKYRTKRARKKAALICNKLVDIEQTEQPYVPQEIFISHGGRKSVVKVNYKAESPFRLIIENKELFVVNEELQLRMPAELSVKSNISSTKIAGHAAEKFIQVLGADRIALLGYEGCEGWYHRNQCLFCDSHPQRSGEVNPRPNLNDLHTKYKGNLRNWLADTDEYLKICTEAFRQIVEDNNVAPHKHLLIMAGNLPDLNLEWEYMLNLCRALSTAIPLNQVDSYLNILPPSEKKYLVEAKEVGLQKLIFNLEVFHEHRFKDVCSGKHLLLPYQQYIAKQIEAAEIFGQGNVHCGFVLGAQPIEELNEGVEYLAGKGIVPDYTVFTPKKGTPWQNKQQPELIEIAKFSTFLHKIYQKYDYKPLYCNLSSRSSIMSDL